MQILTTNAAEIIDFINAEMMINDGNVVFNSREKFSLRPIKVTGAKVLARIANAIELGVSVRSGVNAAGDEVIEIHNGDSVYGRYILSV